MTAQNRATTSRPWYSKGIGGIDMKTSSVRRATRASRSADSHARTNFATIGSPDGELAGRQDLQGGHEGQRDGFDLLVPGLGAGRRVDRALEEGVGERLKPH